MSQSLSNKIKSLRGDSDMWKHVSHRLTDDMINIRVMEKFFFDIEEALNNPSLGDPLTYANSNLPKDKPNTTLDEGITQQDIENSYEKMGALLEEFAENNPNFTYRDENGVPTGDPFEMLGEFPGDADSVEEFFENKELFEKNIKLSFRLMFGRRMLAQQQVEAIQRQAENLHAAAASSEVDPG